MLPIMAKGEVQEDLGDEMEKGGIGNARGSAQTLTYYDSNKEIAMMVRRIL